MARRTSIDAFRKIESQGLLSQRRFQVYRALFDHGPLTAGEVWAFHLRQEGVQIDSVRPRMAELERLGVVTAVGERSCNHSGQTCIVWDVTEHLPERPKPVRRIPCQTCEGKGWLPELKKPAKPDHSQLHLFGGVAP